MQFLMLTYSSEEGAAHYEAQSPDEQAADRQRHTDWFVKYGDAIKGGHELSWPRIGGTIVEQTDPEPMDAPGYGELTAEIAAGQLWRVARLAPVRLLEFRPPRLMLEVERTAQILAARLDGAPPPDTAPVT